MLFILNRDMEVLTVCNNIGNALPYYNDKNIQYLKQASSYEFSVPIVHPDSDKIIEGNYVVRKDLEGNSLMFTIMNVEETHSETKEKRVYCEDAGLELLNELELGFEQTTSQNIAFYINKALSGTGWEIGYCDVTGSKALKFDSAENVLSRIIKIAEEFDGADINFSVELKGSKVTHRYVNIYKQRGENTGKRFTYSKDITKISRKVDMSEVCTALYVEGKTNENEIKTTIFSLAYDNGDIYTTTGNYYLYSRYALDRWGQVGGHIFRIFNYDTEDSSELLQKAILELKNRENPSVTYECDVALLARLASIEEEKVKMGDTVKVVDTQFNPPLYLSARVVQMEISYTDRNQDRCTLGNYQIVKSNIGAELRELQNLLREKEAKWTAGVTETEFKESIEFNEWYASVKTGTNLVKNVTEIEATGGYEWVDDISPNSITEKVLKRKFTAGSPVVNNRFTIGRINIDSTKTYLIEFYIKAKDTNSKYYFGIEEFAQDLENDSGNHPYIVASRTPSSEDVGVWVKHFALIPPHYAGLENSHTTQQSVYTNGEEFKFYSVNTNQIEIKLYMTYSPTNTTIDSEQLATGFALYEVGSSDTLYGEIGSISDKVGQIDNRTSSIEIVKTVTTSPDFESIMSDKANAEDITDMATGKMVSDAKDETVKYIDGRIDGEGGINEQINALSSELTKTANAINAKFTSSGGVNKIMNSLGFAGLDFWTIPDEVGMDTMQTLQNQDLELLGFGSGFFSPQGERAVIEQKINTAREKEFALSFWIKKNKDGANGNAGVEVWQNGQQTAFVGKITGELAGDYELAIYKFTTEFNEVTIRVVIDEGAEAIISGLMINAGSEALQWQHHYTEIYNTNIQFNLNGLKVLSGNYRGYTIVSPKEFSGYYETTNPVTGQPEMTRVFTLNKDTTEVTKLDVDEEIITETIKIVPIKTATINGLAFVSYE